MMGRTEPDHRAFVLFTQISTFGPARHYSWGYLDLVVVMVVDLMQLRPD